MSIAKIEKIIRDTVLEVAPDSQYLYEIESEINKQKIKKTVFVQLSPINTNFSKVSLAGMDETFVIQIAFVMLDDVKRGTEYSMPIVDECTEIGKKFVKALSAKDIEFSGTLSATPVVRAFSVHTFSGSVFRFNIILNDC